MHARNLSTPRDPETPLHYSFDCGCYLCIFSSKYHITSKSAYGHCIGPSKQAQNIEQWMLDRAYGDDGTQTHTHTHTLHGIEPNTHTLAREQPGSDCVATGTQSCPLTAPPHGARPAPSPPPLALQRAHRHPHGRDRQGMQATHGVGVNDDK
jgi:hypothetical protein